MSALLHRPLWRLRFPCDIEREFQASQRPTQVVAIQLGAALAIPLYLITSLMEHAYIAEAVAQIWPVRLAAVIACVFVIYAVSFTRARQVAAQAATLMCIILASLQIAIASLSPPPHQQAQFIAFALPLLYLCTVVRAPFRQAILCVLISFALLTLAVLHQSSLTGLTRLFTLHLSLSLILMMLISNFFSERIARHRFIQAGLLQLHRQRHADNTGHEQEASHAVDGLMPSDEFEQRLLFSVSRHRDDGALALIMASIDNLTDFQRLYDDQEYRFVINTVVRTASRLLPADTGYLAQQDENILIIVLEGVSEADAMILAERLRRDIHMLAIPHRLGEQRATVSLSCGLAHLGRMDQRRGDALLATAARGLARAQRHGGNRCEQPAP